MNSDIGKGTPSAEIGLLGSIFFVGWSLSAPFVMRLVDIYGRKKIYIVNMSLLAITFIGIILSTNFNFTIALMFFAGTLAPGRASISYLYLMDFLLPAH